LENHVCLSCGVQVAGAAWRVAERIVAGVEDLVQRTEDGRTGRIIGGRAIERSGGAVCNLHRARGDEERGFLS
jgi:plasmid stabilization system protein ParE